ncbi:hypothetical protein D3C72_1406770 [compost metagenome]
MGKITAAITRWHGRQIQPLFFQRGRFEGVETFDVFLRIDRMPAHIQQRRAEQFSHIVAFVELRRVKHFLAQIIRHRLTRLIVPGKSGENLRMAGPMFIDL